MKQGESLYDERMWKCNCMNCMKNYIKRLYTITALKLIYFHDMYRRLSDFTIYDEIQQKYPIMVKRGIKKF